MKYYYEDRLHVEKMYESGMFSYFYLPSTNYDFRSCIKAIDYFIRNYKDVFRAE